jgi:hypothetical protein
MENGACQGGGGSENGGRAEEARHGPPRLMKVVWGLLHYNLALRSLRRFGWVDRSRHDERCKAECEVQGSPKVAGCRTA